MTVPMSRPAPRQPTGRDPANTLAGTLVGPRDQARAPVSSSRVMPSARRWRRRAALAGVAGGS
jgi:hypothetical protein